MRTSLVVVALVIGVLATAGSAFASDTIYWSNQGAPPGPGISFADLGGSGGGDLSTAGATSDSAVGVAIDAASGTVYWANANNNTISFASLAGGGGGQLNITGAVADVPFGVAIDPAQGRIYWTNISSDTDPIGYANLDGSGGANLNVTGATADAADGLAVDPVTGKVYWANVDNNTISYANLDGSGGGGQLNTAGVTPQVPNGVAIDSATGKLYWSNFGSDTHPISFADLDGSGGGGNLSTVGATASGAFGLALDPTAGKVYWANVTNNTISDADLTGGGGGQLKIAGSTPDEVGWPALLKAPVAAGSPTITGGSTPGSVLSCSQGSWAPDLVESFLYRAPQSYAYTWTRNETQISGATTSSITATSAGQYACQVTASNHAGPTRQTSAAFVVGAKPEASTIAASSVSAGGAVLNATVNPEGLATGYYFQYGTSTMYGSRAPASNASAGSDTSNHAVSRSVAELSAAKTYHFRVVATNADGTTYGTDQTLTTAAAVLSGLRVSPHKLSIAGRKVHGKCVKPTKKNNADKHCKRPTKLTVSYTLNAISTVRFTLKLMTTGRKQAGKCVKPTKKSEHKKKCARLVSIHGKLLKNGNADANSFTWNGKIGAHKLAPSRYQLTAAPAGGTSKTVTFTVVG